MKGKKLLTLLQQRYEPSTKSKHSKKLEMALRNFITSADGHYYDDELSDGILTSYFRLSNGICVEQKIHIRQSDYVCYTTLSVRASTKNQEQLFRCISTANSINTTLNYGNFEVEPTTGHIRFRTYYKPTGLIHTDAFDKLLGYPLHIIKKHGLLFT